ALGHDLDLVAEEDHADRVLQVVMLREVLRRLRPAHREILVETYIEGRTVAEAAQRLGLPLGTAKSRIYYALTALRAALADYEVASYALGLLDDADATAFEEHLATCDACAEDLESFLPVAALLPEVGLSPADLPPRPADVPDELADRRARRSTRHQPAAAATV